MPQKLARKERIKSSRVLRRNGTKAPRKCIPCDRFIRNWRFAEHVRRTHGS